MWIWYNSRLTYYNSNNFGHLFFKNEVKSTSYIFKSSTSIKKVFLIANKKGTTFTYNRSYDKKKKKRCLRNLFMIFFFISAFSSMFFVWTTISLLLLPNLLQAQEYDVSYDSQECPTKAELGTNQVLKNLLLTVDLQFFFHSFHISEKNLEINVLFIKHYILTIFLKK